MKIGLNRLGGSIPSPATFSSLSAKGANVFLKAGFWLDQLSRVWQIIRPDE